jgi:penicillin-binding protein 1A
MMKGPSRYSPVSATERAARRATIVLDEMVHTRAITSQERAEAFRTPVRVSRRAGQPAGAVFHRLGRQAQVRALVGEPTEDLIVETTLDLPIQAAAEAAVRSGVKGAAGQGVQQAALVAIDGEGRIRAYVGGADYNESQFDRATSARRQAGSAFKPFVYLAAMEAGRTPAVIVVDEPVRIGNWEPRNYTGKYLGAITLQTALAQSVNTVAARLANEVGRTMSPPPPGGWGSPARSSCALDGAGRGRGERRWRWPRPTPPSPTAASWPRATASSASAPRPAGCSMTATSKSGPVDR